MRRYYDASQECEIELRTLNRDNDEKMIATLNEWLVDVYVTKDKVAAKTGTEYAEAML